VYFQHFDNRLNNKSLISTLVVRIVLNQLVDDKGQLLWLTRGHSSVRSPLICIILASSSSSKICVSFPSYQIMTIMSLENTCYLPKKFQFWSAKNVQILDNTKRVPNSHEPKTEKRENSVYIYIYINHEQNTNFILSFKCELFIFRLF
jgi:hypothetical protein